MYKKKKKNVKKFRKKFNTQIVRARQTYSTEELADLLRVSQNTVLLWHKQGLESIDRLKPLLFFGQTIKAFLAQKALKKKHYCKPNELFCCKCQRPSTAHNNTACIKSSPARTNIMAHCSICGTRVNKTISPLKIDFFMSIFSVQQVHTENLEVCTKSCATVE
jgi:hypothetical protein